MVVLAALLLVGCAGADSDGSDTLPATIAVGGVLDAFPATDPPASTTTERVRRATTTTATTAPAVTVAAARTSFSTALSDLVDGERGAPPVTDRVVDDTGRLSLDVPIDWAERDTSAGPLGDGAGAPHVAASPDMRRFLDGYDAAGLTVVVLPGAGDLAEALDAYRFDDDCAPSGEQEYIGPAMSGEYRVWRDCGGTGTDILTVVAVAGRETVLLLAQVREHADLAALDTALDTLIVAAG